MKKDLKIALVLPVYNCEAYLKECLDSLFNQTYLNFEIFAVDDCSTDQSRVILNSYSGRNQGFHLIFNEQNLGVSASRNLALEKIQTQGDFDFIGFVDGDDFVDMFFLEKAVSAIQSKSNVQYFVSGINFFTKKGITSKQFAHKILSLSQQDIVNQLLCLDDWKSNCVKCWNLSNKLFRVDVLKDVYFDTSMKIGEDLEFTFRAIQKVTEGIFLSDALVYYRQRLSSATHFFKDSYLPSLKIFYQNVFRKTNCPVMRKLAEIIFIENFFSFYFRSIANGRTTDALMMKREMMPTLHQCLSKNSIYKSWKLKLFLCDYSNTMILRIVYHISDIINRKSKSDCFE